MEEVGKPAPRRNFSDIFLFLSVRSKSRHKPGGANLFIEGEEGGGR
jgi:hypothetical protein